MDTPNTDTPTIAPTPPELDRERASVVPIIVTAALKLNASMEWRKFRTGWTAIVATGDGDLAVEPVSAKLGVRVDALNGNHNYFTDGVKLANYIKARFRREKERDRRDEEQLKEHNRRNELRHALVKDAEKELCKLFDERIVEACVSVDADVPVGATSGTVRVSVHIGRRIRAVNLSVAEAARFITVMSLAGYDLLKLAEENA